MCQDSDNCFATLHMYKLLARWIYTPVTIYVDWYVGAGDSCNTQGISVKSANTSGRK